MAALEKIRKKVFAHYDCQSMTANLNYANGLSNILNKRRNTTTGASAASMVGKTASIDQDTDNGDGRSNSLVLSCPFFRNELGGEEERTICLNRRTSEKPAVQSQAQNDSCVYLHRPNLASGLALLEDANQARWKLKCCPYQKLTNEKCFIIENCDIGASYYRIHFYGLEHQNWFGIDDHLGPIAISIRKERVSCLPPTNNNISNNNNHCNNNNNNETDGRVQSSTASASSSSHHTHHKENNVSSSDQIKHQYRIILRTSELSVLRGTVYEDYIPALSSSRHNNHNNHHAKEVLEYITPELNLSNLRLGISTGDEQLLKLDEQVVTRTYKVGVLFCKNGQGTEEEMYNNEHSSPQFEEFLSCLGERVRLKGFDKYRAGLDNKTDTTGLYSVYANYHDCEIMFHVSTLLPYTPNNRQQLLRKRHIGNDIVTIVFQEPNALPFTPMNIRSHFQHVFIIVRILPSSEDNLTRYAVAVSRSKEVPVFGPPIPEKGIFVRSKEFTEFLLAKIINGENAAHKSEKFSSMAQRTRHGYLKDLATNYVTNTTLNDVSCGNSASAKLVSTIFGSSKKKGSNRGKDWQFIGDSVIKGAIVWEVSVNDYGQSKLVDCLVGISCDTFIIIEEATKQILFACPNSSILGWDSSHSSYIEIFCHQGECIRLNCKDQGLDLDEINEIKTRLMMVTKGCQTKELILKRNNHGQLGFHIESDGVVTNVEKFAFAWQAGLRPNCRIVKICEVVIATLNYTDMIDYLKTSSTVKITILDPNPEGSPKRGCNLPNCPYLSFMAEGNSNNNIVNSTTRESHPPTTLNTNHHGGDYENIGMMIDSKKYPHSDGKTGLHRFPNSPTATTKQNSIGLPLATSQSSKSLTVSPEKERDVIKIAPFSSSLNIYSNLSCTRLHCSPPSFSGLSPYNTAKRETLRPKSTTSECTSISAPIKCGSSITMSPLKGAPKGAHDHMVLHHLGNVMLSRSELCLASKKCCLPNVNPSSPTNQSMTITDNILPSSTHTRSHSHHFTKIGENSSSLAVPSSYTHSPHPGVNRTGSCLKNPSNGYTGSPSLEWSGNTWSSPRIAKRLNEPPAPQPPTGSNLSPSSTLTSYSSASSREIFVNNRGKPVLAHGSDYSNTRSNSLSDRIKIRSGSHKSSGSSCSGSSTSTSTLQEDLLKLISPDFMVHSNTGDCESNSNTSGGETSTSQYSTPYSSLERSSTKELPYKDPDQVILTVAQPAQVIFSQPSSPSDFSKGKDGSSSSITSSILSRSQTIASLPLSRSSPSSSSTGDKILNSLNSSSSPIEEDVNIDWPTLVDTATKAMASNSEALTVEEGNALDQWLREFGANGGSTNGLSSITSRTGENVKDLEETVKKLQSDLVREQTDKAKLAELVKSLEKENSRLQEEQKTATLQLKTLTDFFFNR